MGYKIIRKNTQVPGEAYDKDGTLYLPVEYMREDFSILEKERVIFIDSPLANLKVGLLDLEDDTSDLYFTESKRVLQGTGCTVEKVTVKRQNLDNYDLLLCLSSKEGVFKTDFGGLTLNGAKRLAESVRWSLTKVFELDYISPPKKNTMECLDQLNMWKKLSLPIISVNWRQKNEAEDSVKLALSLLIGLMRFSTNAIPEIDWELFIQNVDGDETTEKEPVQVQEDDNTFTDLGHNPTAPKEEDLSVQENMAETIYKEFQKEQRNLDETELKSELEVDKMAKNSTIKKAKGKIVKNPSPALKHYLKEEFAKKNRELEQQRAKGKPASKHDLKS
ncbi:hypothetical protein PRVXH_000547 [Proteinivorax hydrogeniformans]|uniref:Uncharacterized protein n=1 Tax=Proteinivorax hydrogeniformans TaxID=1826727 RepID=A0AAU8HV02_9FIRM